MSGCGVIASAMLVLLVGSLIVLVYLVATVDPQHKYTECTKTTSGFICKEYWR